MWHDQLLLTFLSTLCSFCSLSFHFFSFCLSSDKCRLVLPHPVDNVHKQTSCPVEDSWSLNTQPPSATNIHQRPQQFRCLCWDFGTFPRSFWLDSARGSRDTAYLSTFPNVSNLDCSSGSMRLACCLMSSPNPGRQTPGQTSHRSCSEQQMMQIQHGCPSGVQPGMFWHTSPGWQNDVKPWSSKPWQVAKRDGPRCFLVCYITCILAPHPHFVVFCGDCAWRTWRYWLEVVLHFNIFYQNMLTHFTVVMSPPELTTIEPAMATFSEAVAPGVAAFGTGVSLPWCAPEKCNAMSRNENPLGTSPVCCGM